MKFNSDGTTSGPGLGSNSGSGGPVIGITGCNAASKARQDDMYNKGVQEMLNK